MQIIIPMSGFGERFRQAGYDIPKPLIEIEGKPIIAHVIEMFPGERDFLFVCNKDHLATPEFRMEEILHQYCPSGRVVGIEPHKLGPVFAVSQVADFIDSHEPTIINYCDFTCYWDWAHFKSFVAQAQCDGAIPAYKGFHPHSLGGTHYAYMRESQGWVLDIQEKQPYTDHRMEEYASSGTYYFAAGKLMKEALSKTVEQKLMVDGEYYVSLAYKTLLQEKRSVAVYPLQHFMQWGTPGDVAEYKGWSAAFKRMIQEKDRRCTAKGAVVVPLGGLGKRFSDEGYDLPKPLIPVSGKAMVVQATQDLPLAEQYVFVLRTDMPGYQGITEELKEEYPQARIVSIPSVTEGQACSALIGVEALETSGPVTIGACDNGVLYDEKAYRALVNDPDVDVIVWGVRGHASAARCPQMYSWVEAGKGEIRSISIKKPLNDPSLDPIVLGTFTFRRAKDFKRVIEHLIARDGRVNGEFYIDSCINDAIELGLRCYLLEVDSFLSWGTPNELRTFEYWQSCFHKWKSHSYRLEIDPHIPKEACTLLEKWTRVSLPIQPIASSPLKREVSIFLVVGGLTVLVDFVMYRGLVWSEVLGVDIAKAFGFLTGTFLSYFANRLWTFSDRSHVFGSVGRFALLYAVTLGANVLVNAIVLKMFSGIQPAAHLAFLLATGVSAILNFIGMKFFVFKKKMVMEGI